MPSDLNILHMQIASIRLLIHHAMGLKYGNLDDLVMLDLFMKNDISFSFTQ